VYSGSTEVSLGLKLGRPEAVDIRVSGKAKACVG
jgi:hypothetical protein